MLRYLKNSILGIITEIGFAGALVLIGLMTCAIVGLGGY